MSNKVDARRMFNFRFGLANCGHMNENNTNSWISAEPTSWEFGVAWAVKLADRQIWLEAILCHTSEVRKVQGIQKFQGTGI
jgi:hypothetical protein